MGGAGLVVGWCGSGCWVVARSSSLGRCWALSSSLGYIVGVGYGNGQWHEEKGGNDENDLRPKSLFVFMTYHLGLPLPGSPFVFFPIPPLSSSSFEPPRSFQPPAPSLSSSIPVYSSSSINPSSLSIPISLPSLITLAVDSILSWFCACWRSPPFVVPVSA